MGRYSPTVIPTAPDPLDVVNSMWAGYLGYKQNERAEKQLEIQASQEKRLEQEAELNRYERGFRKGPQPQTVAEESLPAGLRRGTSVFEGRNLGIGMQPAQKQGLPALSESLTEAQSRFQPPFIAKPGALVPGANVFAHRAVPAPPVPEPPQMVPDERYPAVPGTDYYMDPKATPEAIADARQREMVLFEEDLAQKERQRRTGAAVAGGYAPGEAGLAVEGMDLPLAQELDLRTKDYLRRLEGAAQVERKYPSTTGSSARRPYTNLPAALNEVRRRYSIYTRDADGNIVWNGYSIPEDQIHAIAEAEFYGLGVEDQYPPGPPQPWTPQESNIPGAQPGSPFELYWQNYLPGGGGAAERPGPTVEAAAGRQGAGLRGGTRAPSAPVPAPAPSSPFNLYQEGYVPPPPEGAQRPGPTIANEEELKSAAKMLEGYPENVVREKLDEFGYSAEDIQYIMGIIKGGE